MSLLVLACPYCNITLPKLPERKTKCFNCGKFYRKRNHPQKPDEYKIVTEEEALEIDKLWRKINNAHVTINIDRKELNEMYRRLDTIREWIKMASMFGSINLDDRNINIFELEEMEVSLIANIDIELSKLQQRWYLDK